ncbi:lysophospholipase L1-like esterase [Paenibacillus taihuensis]|uniref:Lysophospholipase L1-like esterase n=1 Tax=Paenibacillus taihuensis TaxID=1156355 RepID=A0A3D9RXE8_9BACL|nr:SGNH/GDSL hydrolase family protein [Paenibacillus taihuensis]REE84497.1 lysophospholipase L1-like esterase [Paenibacillus taihuensis]
MHVLILGDSLALPRPRHAHEYNPADDEPLAVSFRHTYGARLSEWLSKVYPEPHPIVTNRAGRAFTMVQIHDEFANQLYFMEPNVIILQIGLVDCWPRKENNGSPKTSPNEFESRLSACLKALYLRPHVRLILIGILPCAAYLEQKSPGVLDSIALYNSILKQSVDFHQVFFVDMASEVDPYHPNNYLHSDGYHLSPMGNALVFQKISTLITQFVENDAEFKLPLQTLPFHDEY